MVTATAYLPASGQRTRRSAVFSGISPVMAQIRRDLAAEHAIRPGLRSASSAAGCSVIAEVDPNKA